MKTPVQEWHCDQSGIDLTAKMRIGLGQLLKAHQVAHLVKQDKWEFAVEIRLLREFTLDHSDLRCLLCMGLVEQALEIKNDRSIHRTFRKTSGLTLKANSCFVLSDRGLAVIKQAMVVTEPNGQPLPLEVLRFDVPVWDSTRRELHLGDKLLKRFRQPATYQETILNAFQEENWPARIDDPLPGQNGQNSQDRLHNAVRKLNRQTIRLVRFFSDGMGQGILWEARPK